MLQATKPMHHSYWASTPRDHALQQETPPQWEEWPPQLENSPHAAMKIQPKVNKLYIYNFFFFKERRKHRKELMGKWCSAYTPSVLTEFISFPMLPKSQFPSEGGLLLPWHVFFPTKKKQHEGYHIKDPRVPRRRQWRSPRRAEGLFETQSQMSREASDVMNPQSQEEVKKWYIRFLQLP